MDEPGPGFLEGGRRSPEELVLSLGARVGGKERAAKVPGGTRVLIRGKGEERK